MHIEDVEALMAWLIRELKPMYVFLTLKRFDYLISDFLII